MCRIIRGNIALKALLRYIQTEKWGLELFEETLSLGSSARKTLAVAEEAVFITNVMELENHS